MATPRHPRHRAFVSLLVGLRHQKGWSQQEAADELGWTQSHLAQIETCSRQIYYTEIFELAKAYGVDGLKLFKMSIDWPVPR